MLDTLKPNRRESDVTVITNIRHKIKDGNYWDSDTYVCLIDVEVILDLVVDANYLGIPTLITFNTCYEFYVFSHNSNIYPV